jgi:hypothetical protein
MFDEGVRKKKIAALALAAKARNSPPTTKKRTPGW